ncbi:glycosyltransferase family 4 protein [Carboxylicivirga linearis]|uniref:Glycosyltransferase family 4 protein n=1 Tax=Carboxylicivirga linearis TaxID=1628157 RepID=A0ABS5JXJ4_9BACT|nr:glycosyltransferase family 4 protein [Carboxylicivirga linearis]MBS2099071.1 glycosyltransferase family 4 protein [Carboxylicivirga linearis]
MRNKILIVVSEFPPGPGGIGNHAYSLSKSLVDSGYSVDVLTEADYVSKEDITAFDDTMPEFLKVFRIDRQGYMTYLNRIRRLIKLVKAGDYQAMIVSGKFSLWLGAIIRLFGYQIPTIAVLHGSEVQISSYIPYKIASLSIAQADVLIPVSEFTYSLLNKSLQSKRYRIIPNGIDLDEFNQLKEASNGTLKWIGEPCLLTVGNVTPRKGQHRVIKALPVILEKYPNAHYHIVGLPSHKEEFETLARELGVDSHVTFHGRLPGRADLALAYRRADCFMILSENQDDGDVEGFGIVILEANYFALPAIGAEGCGIADAINEGFNGHLVDGNQPELISIALSKVLEEPQKYEKGSVEWAQQHDWKKIVNSYIEVINQLKAQDI